MRVLVTGATGSLGRELVPAVAAAGHGVRGLSRSPLFSSDATKWARGDIVSGEGLDLALAGVDVVIHAATNPRNAEIVDVGGTQRLLDASKAAGVRHFIYVSIVGIDAIPFPYYAIKLRAENRVRDSGTSFTILRATQFHSLCNRFVSAAGRFPVIMPLYTQFKFQSVDERDVSARLARALSDGPSGSVLEFGGPEVQAFGDMAREWLRAKQMRKVIVPLPSFGAMTAALKAGKSTAPNAERGKITWREWLNRTSGMTGEGSD